MKTLVLIEPNGTERLWSGEILDLPLEIIESNMPFCSANDDEPGYAHVGDAAAIHAALLTDGNETVAGWDDGMEGDACWFEWQDYDPDMDD